MNPQVAIIIPVYNIEACLPKCLDSLIGQTLRDIEIICVNDGSTDNSLNILNRYAEKDPRVKVVNQKNSGVSAARNAGLAHARAEFIGFVDSDDWAHPDTYKEALDVFTKDIDVVSWNSNIVLDGVTCTEKHIRRAKYLSTDLIGSHPINEHTLIHTTCVVWSKLFRKSIINRYNITYPDKISFEDNVFAYTYLLHAKNIYYLDRYFYNYRQRKDSVMDQSHEKTFFKIIDRLKLFRVIYEHYKKYNSHKMYKNFLESRFTTYFELECEACPPEFMGTVLQYASKTAKSLDYEAFSSPIVQYLRNAEYDKIPFLADHANRQCA